MNELDLARTKKKVIAAMAKFFTCTNRK